MSSNPKQLTLIKDLFTFREPGDDFALSCGTTVRRDIKSEIKSSDHKQTLHDTLRLMRSRKGLRRLKFKKLKVNLPDKHTVYQCNAKRKPGRIWYTILDEEPGAVCPTLVILGCSWNKDRQSDRISQLSDRLGVSISDYVYEEIVECDEFDKPSSGRSIELKYDFDMRPMINSSLEEILEFAESQMGIKPTNQQLETMFRPSMPIFVNGQAGTGKTVMLSLRVALRSWHGVGNDTNRRTLVTSMSDKVTEILQDNVTTANNAFRDNKKHGPSVILAKNSLDLSLSESNQTNWKHTPDIDQFHLFRTFRKIQNDLIDKDSSKQLFLNENNVNFSVFSHRFFSRRNYPKGFNAELAWYGIRSIIRGQCLKGSSGNYLTSEDQELVTKKDQFPADKVEILFKCHQDYTSWLNEKGLHDDMDVARNTWLSLKRKPTIESTSSFDGFDEIYLDEAQDLTDLEFRIIIELLKPDNKTSIILAGDPLQTINPSGFSWENLKDMMYQYLKEISSGKISVEDPMVLNQNFRTPKNIVFIGNCVLNKRTNLTRDTPAIQLSNVPEGTAKILIVTEEHKQQLNELFRQDDVITRFIIMNQSDRDGVKKFQKDDDLIDINYDDSRVYSITQVKGLEANTVHLYKFGTTFPNALSPIILQDKPRDDLTDADKITTSYELNKLYIGLTRSRRKILIIESDYAAERFWKAPMFKNLEIEMVKDVQGVMKHLQREIDTVGTPDHQKIAWDLFNRYELERDVQDLEWALTSARKAEAKGTGDVVLLNRILANLNEEKAHSSEEKKKKAEYWSKAASYHRLAQNHKKAYAIYLDNLVPLGRGLTEPFAIWKERNFVSDGRTQSEPLVLRLTNESSLPNDKKIINQLSVLPTWYDKQKHSEMLSSGLLDLVSNSDNTSEQATIIEKILNIDDLFTNATKEIWLQRYSSSLSSAKYWKLAKGDNNLIKHNLSNSQALKDKLASVAENRLESHRKDLRSYLETLKTWHGIDQQAMGGNIPDKLIKKMLSTEFSQKQPSSIHKSDIWPFVLSRKEHAEYIDFCRKSGYPLVGKLIPLLENIGHNKWSQQSLDSNNIIQLWDCFERPLSEFDKSIQDIDDFTDLVRLNSSIRTAVLVNVSFQCPQDRSQNAPRFAKLHKTNLWNEACEDTNLMQALVGFFGEEWKTSPEGFCSGLKGSYEDNTGGAGYQVFESKYELKGLEILKGESNTISKDLRNIFYGRIQTKTIKNTKGINNEHVEYFTIRNKLESGKQFSKDEIKVIISNLNEIGAENALIDLAQTKIQLELDDIDGILEENIELENRLERVLKILYQNFTQREKVIPILENILLENPSYVSTILENDGLKERLGGLANVFSRADNLRNPLLHYFREPFFVYLYKIHKNQYNISDQIEQLLIKKAVEQRSAELSNREETGHLYEGAEADLISSYWWDTSDRYLSSSLMMFHHYLHFEKPTNSDLQKCLDILKIKYVSSDKKSKLISIIYEIFDGAKLLQNIDFQNAYENFTQK